MFFGVDGWYAFPRLEQDKHTLKRLPSIITVFIPCIGLPHNSQNDDIYQQYIEQEIKSFSF